MPIIIVVLLYLYFAFCQQKIAKKLQTENSWQAWVPFLNLHFLMKMAKKPFWWSWIASFGLIVSFFAIIFREDTTSFVFVVNWIGILILLGWISIWKSIAKQINFTRLRVLLSASLPIFLLFLFIIMFDLTELFLFTVFSFPMIIFFILSIVAFASVAFLKAEIIEFKDATESDVVVADEKAGIEEMEKGKRKQLNILLIFAAPFILMGLFLMLIIFLFWMQLPQSPYIGSVFIILISVVLFISLAVFYYKKKNKL